MMAALLAFALAAAPDAAPPRAEKPKLVLMALQASKDIDPAASAGLLDAIAGEVARRGIFSVVSTSDVATLLGAERQKQLLGCSDEAQSCLAELTDALGARFVMSGTVAKLGESYQLTLQTLDSQKAAPLGRSTRIATDLAGLRAQLPWMVAEATAAPLPPPRSRVPSVLLFAGGGLALVAGGVIGFNALNKEVAIRRELDAGAVSPEVLRTLASYREDREEVVRGRNASLALLLVGAGAVVTGAILWPQAPSGSASPQATLVPTGPGFAVVGSF
jgi:TolB-like protein